MRFFIFWIAFFSWFSSVAQINPFIVSEYGLWSTVEINCLPVGNSFSTNHIKFQGDTTLNNLNYKQIWYCDDEEMQDWTSYGFIRENENGAVFLKPPGWPEGKIYDFGVSIGDTIHIHNVYLNSDTLNFIVTTIDSVLLNDDYRKRISLFEFVNNKEEVWVEGLGSYSGILKSGNLALPGAACGNFEALCYQENNVLIYQNPEYTSCHIEQIVGVQEVNMPAFSIYPNPAKKLVTIDLQGVSNWEDRFEIELINLYGEKIFKKNISINKNVLHLPEVNKGIYFLLLYKNSLTIKNKAIKLIVN